MIPQGFAIGLGVGFLTSNKEPDLLADLILDDALAATHPDHTQSFPCLLVANSLGIAQDGVAACFLAAMPAFPRFPSVMVAAAKVVLQGLQETSLDVFQK